jgi:hypothetical protein
MGKSLILAKRICFVVLMAIFGALALSAFVGEGSPGTFGNWKLLGVPPEMPVKIVAPNFVQSQSGRIYTLAFWDECPNSCWVTYDSDLPKPSELALEACGVPPNAIGFVSSAAFCERSGPGKALILQAIDSYGQIYSWSNSTGDSNNIALFAPSYTGGIAGAILGMLILLPAAFSDLLGWVASRARANHAAKACSGQLVWCGFSGIFLVSSFSCSQALSTPAHTQVSHSAAPRGRCRKPLGAGGDFGWLGDGWAVSLNTETSYNWKADADKWTAPPATSMSKVVNIGGKCVNLGWAAVNYVEKPDYEPDWELGANIT